MEKVITFEYSDLCCRSQAKLVREEVIPQFDAKSQVVFDFSNVETIGWSYANELFGVLTRMFGVERAVHGIRLIGANDNCTEAVARAIDKWC